MVARVGPSENFLFLDMIEELTELNDLNDFIDAEDAEFRRLYILFGSDFAHVGMFEVTKDLRLCFPLAASSFLSSSPEMREFVILSLGPAGPLPWFGERKPPTTRFVEDDEGDDGEAEADDDVLKKW